MKKYRLSGSEDKESIGRRVTLLTALHDTADRKANYISELRQKDLNYALVIFAGLFTFTMKFPTLYSAFVSAALLGIMVIFCMLDRRLHKFSHGWRMTQRILMGKISIVINKPERNIRYPRYVEKGEKTAEFWSLQPIIFYCLVSSGLIHLIYFIHATVLK